ncbi:GEVED domain-containing protein [Pseudonocardia sp. TMWB2A]|uniref:GEVED domain-containing protein n=1 Tax=Pseudonocardia sp. TMWB2A TaxID=687430 RepID=UPI00307D039D
MASLVGTAPLHASETTNSAWTQPDTQTATNTTPSGVQITVTLSGPPEFQPRSPTKSLSETGSTPAMHGPGTNFPITIGALAVSTNGLGGATNTLPAAGYPNGTCGVTSTTSANQIRPCGTITVDFNHPVRNPTFHFSGLGGVADGWYASASHTFSGFNGITGSSVNLALVSGELARASNSGASSNCGSTSPPAACGSVTTNATLKTYAIRLNMRYDASSGTRYAPRYLNDGYRFQISVDQDFGDAPSGYDQGSAAGHVLSDLALGTGGAVTADLTTSFITAAPASSPKAGTSATGDTDNAFTSLPAVNPGSGPLTITVPVSGLSKNATLCGWIDFNRGGTFDNVNERACASPASGATSANLTWTIPTGANYVAGASFARFRLGYTAAQVQSPTGLADSGEVEDYAVTLNPMPQSGITLIKRWMNATPNNRVNLTITGGTSATSATSQAGAPDEYAVKATASGTAGTTITLSENFIVGSAVNYTTTFDCKRDSDGSTVSTSGNGLSRTMTMPNSAVTCTFTNTGPAPAPRTPGSLTGVKTCPAANLMNTNQTLQAGWNHNWPPNNMNADEGAKTDFITYSSALPGPGITYIPSNTAGVARLVDTQNAAAALGAGDYVDYMVRTGTAPVNKALYQIRYGVNNETQWVNGYPFTFTILISTDPTFATAQTILADQTTPFNTSGVYQPYTLNVPASSRFLLQNNTSYYFRVLLYATNAKPTDYDTAIWDDFAITTADCLTSTVRLAKSWTNGTAGHQASATTTGAINNNATFTSTAPTATTGTAVTVYQGETITLPAESYSGGATAALYNTTVACTGGATLASGATGRSITIPNNNTATTCTYNNAFVGPLTVTKTSAPVWDPANLTTNPKMIPGAYIDYTIDVKSPATTADSNSVIVTDALPSQINLCVAAVGQCTLPVRWTVGTSGLTCTYTSLASTTDDVSFSTDGTNWNYVPVAGAEGTDPAIRHVRVNPKGAMNPNSQFSILLRTLIK